MTDNAGSHFEKIFFHSDQISMDEIRESLKHLIVQKQRWLGSFHPDSRIRCEALRASGVKVGAEVFISIGMVVLDDYKGIVSIGDRSAFGNYVSLVAASAPNNSLLRDHPEIVRKCIKILPITIENDVWVGTGVIILPGVTVGEKSVIGAGAVLTRNIPPYSIVAGIPGKVIRTISKK